MRRSGLIALLSVALIALNVRAADARPPVPTAEPVSAEAIFDGLLFGRGPVATRLGLPSQPNPSPTIAAKQSRLRKLALSSPDSVGWARNMQSGDPLRVERGLIWLRDRLRYAAGTMLGPQRTEQLRRANAQRQRQLAAGPDFSKALGRQMTAAGQALRLPGYAPSATAGGTAFSFITSASFIYQYSNIAVDQDLAIYNEVALFLTIATGLYAGLVIIILVFYLAFGLFFIGPAPSSPLGGDSQFFVEQFVGHVAKHLHTAK